MNNTKILVVDDDEKILRILKLQLEHSGFTALFACDGNEAIEVFENNPQTAVALLDIMLPGLDGISLCSELKKLSKKLKIIMVSAKGRSADIIEGLNAGADDYVIKPFVFDELLARINANLRELKQEQEMDEEETKVKYLSLELDTKSFEVYYENALINLSKTEFDLLYYLTLNHGIVLSRAQIASSVWGYEDYDGNVVDMYIKYLRDKLDKNHEEKLIHTVRGRGYVLK